MPKIGRLAVQVNRDFSSKQRRYPTYLPGVLPRQDSEDGAYVCAGRSGADTYAFLTDSGIIPFSGHRYHTVFGSETDALEDAMLNARMHIEQGSHGVARGYTVICKSGQRGVVFSDPELAAQAFLRARVHDRPFVLRHHGGSSIVIASAKDGKKRIEPAGVDDTFSTAYECAADALLAS